MLRDLLVTAIVGAGLCLTVSMIMVMGERINKNYNGRNESIASDLSFIRDVTVAGGIGGLLIGATGSAAKAIDQKF